MTDEANEDFVLQEGDRVAVIGGGPAGSFFAHSLLQFARRMRLLLQVDIYEPRDFASIGPGGCNVCGRLILTMVHLMTHLTISSQAILNAVVRDRRRHETKRRTSAMRWDTFTGSAPYQDIFYRTLHPMFLAHFCTALLRSVHRLFRSGSGNRISAKPV